MFPRQPDSQNDNDALAAAALAARRAGPAARPRSRPYKGARATAITAAIVVILALLGVAIWYQYGRVQQQNRTEQARRETLEAFQRIAADAKTDAALDRFDGHIADAQFALDRNRNLLIEDYRKRFDDALVDFSLASNSVKQLDNLKAMEAEDATNTYVHVAEDTYKKMEVEIMTERSKHLQKAMAAVDSLAGEIGR